tara:strand:+ start:1107 stop:3281 length:2175 start_codon:yes stop_codon:yes gene_type:complete
MIKDNYFIIQEKDILTNKSLHTDFQNSIKKLSAPNTIFYLSSSRYDINEYEVIKKNLSNWNMQHHQHMILIGQGGEGYVFLDLFDENTVVKIFFKNKDNNELFDKLSVMKNLNINHDSICWPRNVFKISDRAAYSTIKASGKELALLMRKPILEQYEFIDRKYIVMLTLDILNKISYLHQNNILLGDINLTNILIDIKKCKSFFVDTDSYQFDKYRCNVGSIAFTAPEIQNKNFKTFERTIEHENFAVATLLFILLHCGQRPYSLLGGSTTQKNIANQNFVYPYEQSITNLAPKGIYENMWNMLSPSLKRAFYDCFKNGNRPSVESWIELFKEYLTDLENDKFTNKYFPESYNRTINTTNFNLDNQSFKSIGEPKNVINQNGAGFAVLELGSKSMKLIFYRDKDTYHNNLPFDFNLFQKKSNLAFTSSAVDSDNMILLNRHNPASYQRTVLGPVKGLIRYAENAGIKELYIFAGGTLRKIKNLNEVISLYSSIGKNIRVIDSDEESKLNLMGYLFSQNLQNLDLNCMLMEWGVSSFRFSLFDRANNLIFKKLSNKLGVKSLTQFFEANNPPDITISQAFNNYDLMIKQYSSSIFEEIESFMGKSMVLGLGDPFKRTVTKGGSTIPKIHNRIINSDNVESRFTELDENLKSSKRKVKELPSLIYRYEHEERKRRDTDLKTFVKSFELRLCLPIIKKLIEFSENKEIQFSGTGVWYGAFKQIKDQE